MFRQVERCSGLPSPAPETPFDGVLVSLDIGDGIKAYRAGVATTYYLAFDGSNFTRGAAVSPDGKYLAVPYGVITSVTSTDVRYTVQEIRIVTTETVPRIALRIPWRASFPVGTPFTSDGDVPQLRWLDSGTFQYLSGAMSGGHAVVEFTPFADEELRPSDGFDVFAPSPDGAFAISMESGGWSLVEMPLRRQIAKLPMIAPSAAQAAWSPDSQYFAITDKRDGVIALRLYDISAREIATIDMLPENTVLWNLKWSPDGARLAYTVFDPQTRSNRLHAADIGAQTVTDMCLSLVGSFDFGRTSALAWSPDGTSLAVLTAQAALQPQISIVDADTGTRYTLSASVGTFLGWYP